MSVTDEDGRATAADHPAGRRTGSPGRRSVATQPAGSGHGWPFGAVRTWRRPTWWQELLFIGGSYLLYTLTRNSVPAHQEMARHRAVSVLHVEQALGLDLEHSANVFLAKITWLAVTANYYYATMHFAVTIGVLVWLYVQHPWRYRSVRTVLYATNLIALLGFWLFPLAPPRMLPGYVDTVVHFHTWGSWGSGDVAAASNQFAAMPSLHIGWSLWCGITLWKLAKPMWLRLAGAAYPVATLLVIIGTANHFVLDAVGGVVALSLGFAWQRLVFARPAYALPAPSSDEPAPGGAAPASAT